MIKRLCLIGASLLLTTPMIAQTLPAAEGSGISLWAGASVSSFNPDYGCASNSPFTCGNQLIGIAPFVHTNGFLLRRVGFEGQARFLHWHGPTGLTESSYLAGPRANLFRYKKLLFSGKFMIGDAHLNIKGVGNGSYLAYAPGCAVDYRIKRRLFARVDYEYQIWPSFQGAQTGSGHGGLTPNGFSVGLSYGIWH